MAHTPPKLRPTSLAADADRDSRRRWIGLGLLVVAFVIGGVFFDIYGQGIYGDDDAATASPPATIAAGAASPAAD